MANSYCIGNFVRNFRSNKVKLPWAVHIREAKCTYGEATFLISYELQQERGKRNVILFTID